MKALVVFGTTEGHTRKIAEQIGFWLRDQGFKTEVIDSDRLERGLLRGEFDLCVLAGSLHMGKHQASLVQFARQNATALRFMPTLLVSSSATGSRTDPSSLAKANECIELFVHESGFRPTVAKPVGGALLYTKYNPLLRWTMRKIAEKEGGPTDTSRDHELTDWLALERVVSGFVDQFVRPALVATERAMANTYSSTSTQVR